MVVGLRNLSVVFVRAVQILDLDRVAGIGRARAGQLDGAAILREKVVVIEVEQIAPQPVGKLRDQFIPVCVKARRRIL